MRTLMVLAATIAVSACASAKPAPTPVSSNEPNTVTSSPAATGSEVATGEVRQALLHLQRVHFAYRSAALVPSAQRALTEAAGRLANHPEVAIYVEGYTDRRGEDAYNLTLGQQRAQAVARFLQSHGVGSDRLNIVSYGRQHPLAEGATVTALATNRRADFKLMRGNVELVIDDGALVDDVGRPLTSRHALAPRAPQPRVANAAR